MSTEMTLRQAIDAAVAGGNGFRVGRGLGWDSRVFVNGTDIVSPSSEYTRLWQAEWKARVDLFGVSLEEAMRMGDIEVEEAIKTMARDGHEEAMRIRHHGERLVGKVTLGDWPDFM